MNDKESVFENSISETLASSRLAQEGETGGTIDGSADGSSAAPRISSKRSRLGFYKVLILVMVMLIAAIGAGTVYFWKYISAFEDSRLEHVIEDLQTNIDYGYWERNVERAIASRLTEFESGGAVPLQPYLPKIRDVRYDFRQKTDETRPEAPVYIIRAGALDIGIVRFVPTVDIGYGFNKWEVGSIEFLDSFIDSFGRSIRITASENAGVSVNGVPVSSGYLVECDIEYGATYLIDRIFGDVEISVLEFDGRESGLSRVENGWYHYPVTIPFSRVFNIVVPEGCTVFVDGGPIPPDKITDDAIVPEIFVGAIDPSKIPMFMHRYEFQIDGLYLEPVITASDAQGRELLLVGSDAAASGLSDCTELHYIGDYSSEYKETHSGTVEAFIRAYVNFAANVGGNVNANISRLFDYVLRGSELYSRIQASRSAMEWVASVAVAYNTLAIDDFRPYGDNFFSCEVSYDITNRTHAGERELAGCFEILFESSNGKWLAVNMMAI